MCANYIPVTRSDRLLAFFGVQRARDEPPADVYPTGLAPFIRLAEDGSGRKLVDDGAFGLLPHFAKEVAYGRKTYNARSETVHSLPSFRESWLAGRRCIVPAETIFEVCWETGEAVRWAIEHPGQVGIAVAGLYRQWRGPGGRDLFSFTMLTVNADGHPIFARMHRPGEEKRMVVILESDEHDAWLAGTPDEARRFFRPYLGPLVSHPAPRPKRAPQASSVRTLKPPPPDDEPGLFDA
ncbi:MAG: SOS response-associated peptidase family protein [Burkholderiaceae bacterium]